MNYYNENDPKAAAWLRELIRGGHIASGIVDERSIVDVRASELSEYRQCHFFAGIGGWSLALRLAGWPDDKPVWTGSCPCQPFSSAGKQMGNADSRHLFPTFRKLIARCQPPVVFGEQVASALGREWLARVRSEMASLGYATRAADLCSAGVGSPNIRQRLYWLADAKGKRFDRSAGMQGAHRRRLVESIGATGGMEHASGNGREQWRAESIGRGVVGGCAAIRLANTDGGISGDGELQRRGRLVQQPKNEDPCGLGDTNEPRPQGRDERGNGADKWTPWTSSVVLPCTDGKARRIESGSFPLAYGVSGRVGLLRGYGNAINPWLAAEFIRACEESIA